MLFANDDDDADFTVQPGSSKLANLFSDNEAAKTGNSSLTYTPPKQPSVGKASDKQSSSTLSLLHAAAVQAFKYEGKKPSNLGRLGIAVLGNHEKRTYSLILYKEKQQQVASAAISPQFAIKLLGNNFLSFADEKRCNWSVKFENEEAVANFVKQAVIARALSLSVNLAELTNCICQDLVLPGESEGDSIGHGSTAVIKYTAWLLTSDCSLKKVFDTTESDEPQKIKVGRGKQVKGLEEGLVGCKKNSRKLLIVPPSHGYGSKGSGTTIPPNSVLVYDVTVISVGKPKSAAKDSTPRSSTPVSVPAGDADKREARSSSHGSVDEPARSRAPSAPPDWSVQQPPTAPPAAPGATASFGESDKARLLSRMAKIGAQMLPMPGAVPAQPSSDSEVEDERPPPVQQVPTTVPLPQPAVREGSPKPVVKPRSFSQQSSGDTISQPTPIQPAMRPMVSTYGPGLPAAASAMPAAQHMALYQAQTQLAGALAGYPYQQQGILLPPPHAYLPAPVPSAASTALDAQLPVLLSETRSQNTEVRLNISKLADKVDYIIGKLDTLKSQPPAAPPLSSYMDSEALLHNIQRIVQENVKLKNESSEKNSKIQALNEKICDLLQQNQRLMEESNTMFEQRSDTLHSSAAQSQARLLALEAEKMEVSERLSQTLSELSLLKAELSERQHKESQAEKELGELQSTLEGNKNMLKSLEDSLKEAEQEKQDLARQITACKDASAKENAAHSSEQVAQLEESISAHWKSVCDTETKKLNSRISALEAEKETLLARVTELDFKCTELATSAEKQRKVYEDKMRQLQVENQALSTGATSATATVDFDAELKKIMNTLFKLLQREFSHEETYSSKEAKGIILNCIRDYTTAVLERRQASAALDSGASRASSSLSNSSVASLAASPATAAAAAEATASQPQQSDNGAEKQEEKHDKVPESATTQPDVEMLSKSPPSGPGQHKCPEPAAENSLAEASGNSVAQTAKDIGPVLPQEVQGVAPTGDENKAADSAKEGASGDAEISSPSSESKTEKEAQAETKNVQTPDWSWKPQPPPPPLFDEYEDDDWLN
uniref:peptidylprolyl isomerase n=1 Tax=Amblyomma triste TaxID=251400 RepID=A0A023GFZ1_AMBTT